MMKLIIMSFVFIFILAQSLFKQVVTIIATFTANMGVYYMQISEGVSIT